MQARKLFALTLFTLISTLSYSQHDFRQGYVVTNQNDTIHGYIDYVTPGLNARSCFFRKEKTGEVIEYTPTTLSAYAFTDGKVFISKQLPENNVTNQYFFEYLVDGVLDLFYKEQSGEDQYYLEKNKVMYQLSNDKIQYVINDQTYQRDSKDYIRSLNFLMQDAGFNSTTLEKVKYDLPSLVSITKQYHTQVCDTIECKVYYKKEKKPNDIKWKVRVGVGAEFNWSSVDLNSYINNYSTGQGNNLNRYNVLESNASFNSRTTSISPLVFVNFNRNRRISWQIGFKYQKSEYPQLVREELKVPVGLNYEFQYYKKLKPYINANIVTSINLHTETKDLYFIYESLDIGKTGPPTYTLSEGYIPNDLFNSDKIMMGLGAGLGTKYDFSENSAIRVELRGEILAQNYLYRITGDATTTNELRFFTTGLQLSYIF